MRIDHTFFKPAKRRAGNFDNCFALDGKSAQTKDFAQYVNQCFIRFKKFYMLVKCTDSSLDEFRSN